MRDYLLLYAGYALLQYAIFSVIVGLVDPTITLGAGAGGFALLLEGARESLSRRRPKLSDTEAWVFFIGFIVILFGIAFIHGPPNFVKIIVAFVSGVGIALIILSLFIAMPREKSLGEISKI
jgi:uncharacterized membrane protein HdeD (DUF308 family)